MEFENLGKGELVSQPSGAPTAKVKAGGFVGIAVVALVAAATALVDLQLPGVVGAVIAVVATVGASYLKRERKA